MNLVKNVIKKGFVIAILLVVGITMSFGVTTDEVSAASKKPSKVKITSIQSYDYNSVKITWKKAKNTKKYQVYRAASKNGKYKLVKTTTSRSYINKQLTTGKKYYYKVRGVNGSKKGRFSSKKYAVPKLKKTNGVKVTSSDHNSISISWNKVNGAKGYQVYRAGSKTGTYKKVKSTTVSNFTNTGLTVGKTYYYKVRAYRIVNGKYKYGALSSTVSERCEYNVEKSKANLDTAQSELTLAEDNLAKAENTLNEAEKTLENAKDITIAAKSDLDKANEVLTQAKSDYEKKKAEAQKIVDDAKASYDNVAMEFILDNCLQYEDSNGNTVDSLIVWKETMKQYSSLTPYVGDKFDKLIKEQFTVNNLKKFMGYIDECNELRASDNNFKGLSELYVDYDLMLYSAISNSISAQAGYSKGHLLFNACLQNYDLRTILLNASGNTAAENLAWGYSDPFSGWYHDEKEMYDAGDRSGEVGHYLNIVGEDYNTIGFSITNNRASQQCFGYARNASLTTEGFLSALESYIQPKKAVLDNAVAALNAISNAEVVSAQAKVDAKKAAYDKAVSDENIAKKAVTDAAEAKSKAEKTVAEKEKTVNKAEAAYNEALKYHNHEWAAVYKEVDNGYYKTEIYDKCSYCGADVTATWTSHFKEHALEGIPEGFSCSAVTGYREVWVPKIEKVIDYYECSCRAHK